LAVLKPRRKTRELALKALYMLDMRGEASREALRNFWRERRAPRDLISRADKLVKGVLDNKGSIDELIARTSEHWRLERMSRVDRNILRLAVYEMLYDAEVPGQVSIDEAVEIAKRYGHIGSSAFINGVLDKIWKEAGRDAP